MPLPDDLLLQAHHLATWDTGKPKQASLRRAYSTTYYALFHLLVSACTQRLGPLKPTGLKARIGRAVSHVELKEVCVLVARERPGAVLEELLPEGFSIELRELAKIFIDLQEERHRADYDALAIYNCADTIFMIEQTQKAFSSWHSIKSQAEIDVFLCAILFSRRWGR